MMARMARKRTRNTPSTAAAVNAIRLPPGWECVGYKMDVWLVVVLSIDVEGGVVAFRFVVVRKFVVVVVCLCGVGVVLLVVGVRAVGGATVSME